MKTLTAKEAAACLMQLRGGQENSRRSNPVSVAVRRRIEDLELQLRAKAIMECNAPEPRPKFELEPRERSPGVELPKKVVNPCHITKLSRHKPFRVGHRYWGLSASSVKVSFLVTDRRRGRHGEEIMEAVMFGDRRCIKLTPTSMYEIADTPAEWVRRGWVLEGVLCSCDIVRHNEIGVAKMLKPAPKPVPAPAPEGPKPEQETKKKTKAAEGAKSGLLPFGKKQTVVDLSQRCPVIVWGQLSSRDWSIFDRFGFGLAKVEKWIKRRAAERSQKDGEKEA